jgi:hypothetical protein
LVLRHRPVEAELNKVLPWLAAEKPDVFNAYQRAHGPRLEAAMTGAKYLVSCIRRDAGRALFIGIYRIAGSRSVSQAELWQTPEYRELTRLGAVAGGARPSLLHFDLPLTDLYAHWKGKLVIGWPPPERVWWRRAHRNFMPVLAILEESALDAEMPAWEEIDLTWDELAVLPLRWRAKLAEWRAIYYIFDTSDAKGYVGSAYGGDNLLGRWLGYAATGHGGNRLLRQRDHRTFRFSILQRVSPDMDAADVIRLEASWKDRLHTRHPVGLNDN